MESLADFYHDDSDETFYSRSAFAAAFTRAPSRTAGIRKHRRPSRRRWNPQSTSERVSRFSKKSRERQRTRPMAIWFRRYSQTRQRADRNMRFSGPAGLERRRRNCLRNCARLPKQRLRNRSGQCDGRFRLARCARANNLRSHPRGNKRLYPRFGKVPLQESRRDNRSGKQSSGLALGTHAKIDIYILNRSPR